MTITQLSLHVALLHGQKALNFVSVCRGSTTKYSYDTIWYYKHFIIATKNCMLFCIYLSNGKRSGKCLSMLTNAWFLQSHKKEILYNYAEYFLHSTQLSYIG